MKDLIYWIAWNHPIPTTFVGTMLILIIIALISAAINSRDDTR